MFGLRFAVVLVLLTAAFFSSVFWSRAFIRGEAISASAHWGGLGGGTSGWRVTLALVSLVAALFLWALGAALSVYALHVEHSDTEAKLRNEREDAATTLKTTREDAATKLLGEREDAATKLRIEREEAKTALEERHRAEERADKLALQRPLPAPQAATQSPTPKPLNRRSVAPATSASP
jgi:hypothetical protein